MVSESRRSCEKGERGKTWVLPWRQAWRNLARRAREEKVRPFVLQLVYDSQCAGAAVQEVEWAVQIEGEKREEKKRKVTTHDGATPESCSSA